MQRARLVADGVLGPVSVPPPWPGRPVLVDGAVSYVRHTPGTSSDAEPALYLHGLGGSSQNWTDLAGLLALRLDGEAIDLPGFGHSEPARSYTIAAFAQRAVRYLEHRGRGPVHLIGNSLGGAVAIRLTATRPDLVRTLTLISPAMPFLDPRRTAQARVLPLLALPRAEWILARALTRLTPEEMAREVLAACVADLSRICEQRRQEAVEEIRHRHTVDHYPSAYLGTMRGLVTAFIRSYLPGASSLWRMARAVPVPTLVIGGTLDRLVDVRVARQVARLIPDSRLLMLAGVGHVAQLEVPRTVARAVLALLDEADRTPPAPLAGQRIRIE